MRQPYWLANIAASAFSPANISNLVAWWRADSGVTIGTGVSAWTSRVNGYVLQQATAVNQPAFTAADATFNNKPALEFSVLSGLRSTAAASVWKFIHDGSGCTILCAQKLKDVGNNLLLWTGGIGPGGTGLEFLQWNAAGGTFPRVANGTGLYFCDGPEATLYNLAGVSGLQIRTATVRFKRTTSAWADVAPLVGAPSSGNPTNTLSVGLNAGANPWIGTLPEIAIYNRYLSDVELASLYTYMATRYGF